VYPGPGPLTANGELLGLLALHLVLTGLPGVAASLWAGRMGVRQVPVLLAIALAASGAVAILSFWAYYADPAVGETWVYFVLFGSIALTVRSLWGGRLDPALLRQLATPAALWGLGSAFVLFLGFLHGGTEEPLMTAATRFGPGPLPRDNAIPLFYADWFFAHGHAGVPPVFPGEWLSSDRPPLQIGYVLSQRRLAWDGSGLHYQVLGVVLQQLWIVGLWALLLAARLGRMVRALVMLAALASPLAILNGFFVWPKMLPAAMLLAAAALVLTPLWPELRRKLWAAGLIAALLAFAMLGHGSSLFAIVPLALLATVRGVPSWRWLAVALLVGFALTASWSAYQKYHDPPGNRLNKWMLAGVVEIDGRGTSEAIADSYGSAGVGGTLHNKVENFVTMAGGGPALTLARNAVEDFGSNEAANGLRAVRSILFLYLLPSLALLLIAPAVMLARRRDRARDPVEWRFALTCFAVVAVGALFWGLVLFGIEPARTVIHVGSFALPILGIAGCVVGLRAVAPRAACLLVAASALLGLAVYVASLEPRPGSAFSPLAGLLAAVGLAGFCAVAFRKHTPCD